MSSTTACLKLRLRSMSCAVVCSLFAVRHGRHNFTWQLLGISDQCRPLVGRLAGGEHAPEHLIRIALATALTQAAFVIDPCVDDDARPAVIAEEQPEPTEELNPEPVPVRLTERVALTVLGPGRIGGDDLQQELCQCRK